MLNADRLWHAKPRILTSLALVGLAVALAGGLVLELRADAGGQVAAHVDEPRSDVPPDTDKVTLKEALGAATIPVYLPSADDADTSNTDGIYLTPSGGQLTLTYPVPGALSKDSADLDMKHIEIIEQAWTYGDPRDFYKSDLSENPDVGKALCDVGGITAECEPARSPSSLGTSNPAALRLRIGENLVQLYGTSSLDELIKIAESMLQSQDARKG